MIGFCWVAWFDSVETEVYEVWAVAAKVTFKCSFSTSVPRDALIRAGLAVFEADSFRNVFGRFEYSGSRNTFEFYVEGVFAIVPVADSPKELKYADSVVDLYEEHHACGRNFVTITP
jgi:hypothetical protein